MNKHIKHLHRICAFAVGLVFVLSGTFKLMDPAGTAIKVGEWLNFFHIGFMRWFSWPAAICLSLAETGIGIALVTGVWRKASTVLATSMVVFFTFITALLAVSKVEMDCGCFGEVIHLTKIQTLLKNLVLLVLCLVALLPFRDFGIPKRRKYAAFAIASVSSVILLLWSMLFLPFKDHTDFKPGSQLQAARSEAEENIFEASFVYEKDGVEKVFSLEEDLPDSSWHFVRTEMTGTVTKASNLQIRDWETNEYVDSIASSGNVLVISYYRRGKEKEKAHRLLWDAKGLGYTPICLSLSEKGHDEFCYASDRRTLLGLNRSNGGATLIQDGLIIKKWSCRNLPSAAELAGYAEEEPLETIADVQSRANLLQQSYLLYVFTVLFLL